MKSPPQSATAPATRDISLATSRVTSADVAVSPDGAYLVFSMLGHLFRVPVTGGEAEQLTFGPAYDKEPVYSPDGTALAFTSDRDGSESNIFLLFLDSGRLTQVTRDPWADLPTFSPDGRAIVYARRVPDAFGSFPTRNAERLICRVQLEDQTFQPITTAPRHIGSILFLADGRLAWTVAHRCAASSEHVTNIEVLSANDAVSVLGGISGVADWAVAPALGDTVYVHRLTGCAFEQWIPAATEDVIAFELGSGAVRTLFPVTGLGRFAVSADGSGLYLGDRGRLYHATLPSAAAQPIDFSARVRLTLRGRATPARVSAAADGKVRALQTPRLSPNGDTLVFAAAGFLWRQKLSGDGPAQRLTQDDALELSPAFCPVGRTLAYVARRHSTDSVVLLDLEHNQPRTLYTGVGVGALSFSADGARLLGTVNRGYADESVISIEIDSAAVTVLFPVNLWSPRPAFSADGHSVYYCSNNSGIGNVYRRSLDEDAVPRAVTQFIEFVSEPQLTPDERTLVFRRNSAVFAVPLTDAGADERSVRQLSPEGGDAFSLTPDGSCVIYAAGPRVWIQPLDGSTRHELPVRLVFPTALPPATLIKGVRLLDFDSGGFHAETSLLIERGCIRRIGESAARAMPDDTRVLDARGRYAIPGLFDFHVHCGDANAEAFIAYGITAVRDTGYNLNQLNALEDRSERTGAALPRYFYSGELFESQRPYWGDRGSLLITHEHDARDYVRRLKALGVSFVKVYPSLCWRLQRTVCEEALRQGLPVVGHGTSLEEITKGVTLGLYSLEHVHLTGPVYDDVLTMLSASGTHWTPTLASMGADSLLLRDRPEEVADPRFVGLTPPCACHFASFDVYHGVGTTTLRGVISADLASIRRAAQLGVHLHAGTDAPTPKCFFGSSLHWELERMVEAGLAPLEVVRIASHNAARALGREDLGSLEVGKTADLVLLDHDPLADIRHTRSIWRVIKGGWVFDPNLLLHEINEQV